MPKLMPRLVLVSLSNYNPKLINSLPSQLDIKLIEALALYKTIDKEDNSLFRVLDNLYKSIDKLLLVQNLIYFKKESNLENKLKKKKSILLEYKDRLLSNYNIYFINTYNKLIVIRIN